MTFLRFSTLFALTALALTGCSAATDVASEEGLVSDMAISYPADESVVMLDRSDEMGVSESGSLSVEPDVITTGYLSLIVEVPSTSADEITALVVEAGGRISSRSDYSPIDYGSPSAYLEIRIPVGALEATVSAISERGDVQESSINTYDVSLQKLDLDARISVLESAIERLGVLLEQAENTSDLIATESALSDRQAELDSLNSQREYLSDQTLFATISVNLFTSADATPTEPEGFVDGILRGLASIVAFFAGMIVWAGILLPWLGMLAVVLGVVVLVRRVRRKKN
jgi:hypothetical protein